MNLEDRIASWSKGEPLETCESNYPSGMENYDGEPNFNN